jgi:membrane fusion protein (multidrug efflux system)
MRGGQCPAAQTQIHAPRFLKSASSPRFGVANARLFLARAQSKANLGTDFVRFSLAPSPMSRSKPLFGPQFLFVLLATSTIGTVACGSDKPSAQAEKPSELKPAGDNSAPELRGTRVEVAVVNPSNSGLTMRVPGEVEGIRDALLSAALGGYIEHVNVKEGQHVKQGMVLGRVDSQTYSTRLARAQVEKEAAERELARAEGLGDSIAVAELDAAKDRVAAAKAALNELHVAVSRTVVSAPFEGVVVEVNAEVGEVAGPGAPLFRLVQLDPVRVSIALSDRDMALAQVGMPASVDLAARSGSYIGKVVQLSKAADLKTRSFEALVEVENKDGALLPGMIAQVSLSTTSDAAPEASRLLISQDWLVTDPEGVGAFVAENGKAVWRPLKLGAVVRRQVEVLDGLKTGDALIIVGHRSLAEGDEVLVHRKGVCCDNGRATFTE